MNETRIRRVRDLVHRLNRERRKQSKKIDILCNDMVDAHRQFVRQISSLNFTVSFYEKAMELRDLSGLLETTINMIENRIEGASVSIFMLGGDSFDIHMSGSDQPVEPEEAALESCFTDDVVKEMSRWVHVCSLDEMCHAGLQASPVIMKSVSAAGIPLGLVGEPFGFILIQRPANYPLVVEELEGVTGITGALCSAIKSVRSKQVSN